MTAIEKQGYAARQAARQLAVTTTEEKNWALEAIARALLARQPTPPTWRRGGRGG